jgi:hypothetical protein
MISLIASKSDIHEYIIMYPPNTLGTSSKWFILDVVKE